MTEVAAANETKPASKSCLLLGALWSGIIACPMIGGDFTSAWCASTTPLRFTTRPGGVAGWFGSTICVLLIGGVFARGLAPEKRTAGPLAVIALATLLLAALPGWPFYCLARYDLRLDDAGLHLRAGGSDRDLEVPWSTVTSARVETVVDRSGIESESADFFVLDTTSGERSFHAQGFSEEQRAEVVAFARQHAGAARK